jgi:PAS domain S-box-containing protein
MPWLPLHLRARPARTSRTAGLQRRVWSWWRRLTPTHHDRLAAAAPLTSVLLFLTVIVAAFWYLRNEEFDRELESVKRDTELVQQQIRLRLIENQDQLTRMARELTTRGTDRDAFYARSEAVMRGRQEIVAISWLNAQRQLLARQAVPDRLLPLPRPAGTAGTTSTDQLEEESRLAFNDARDLRTAVYARPLPNPDGSVTLALYLPVIERGALAGALVAEYSLDALLRHFVPPEVARRHLISVLDGDGEVLTSTYTPQPGRQHAELTYSVAFTQIGHGLQLRGEGYRTSFGLVGNTLFWMVVALSALIVWMLMGTWRHMRRRLQIQGALVQETNFRRAMENSMLTGMRAMDLDGRITYVNPAFCAMTGFSEAELIGCLPPFPHWPQDKQDENNRLLQQELSGRSPPGGIEVKVLRKDGSQFDARMYVSPLIDAKGQQTGWMTSMTNITEAKRIRDQLTASHERFTTVLEGLDAAVSVISVQTGELLFVNRSYRLWFGADARFHTQLAGNSGQAPGDLHPDAQDAVDGYGGLPASEITEAGSDAREVHLASLDKWFDVRARYLQWTDGRLAQMLIATDITARRHVEEQMAQQAERAQVTSRLVTMGEMASSVAHELNQPLTAISNYCNGMISRLKAGTIVEPDLIAALDKTARQAQRAGQIIHRIRSFVKKSEPQRQAAKAGDIVEDTVELAGIELRRRNVQIHVYVAQRLPVLHVDPILIEQVLLNLLKNGAEAIDTAKMPSSRRHIELRVVPRYDPDIGGVIEFTVTDTGPGIKEDVIGRLYEAFFSTKLDGLGIGLSLCRSIVESHKGRIKAENLYNAGTVSGCRFTVSLPVNTSTELSFKQAETS